MRIICLLIFLATTASPAMAQEASDQTYGQRDGRGALLFHIDRLNLNGYGGIGGRYWLSDLWAMNASVTLYQHRRSDENDGGSTRDYLATHLGFSTALERHLLRTRLSPYVGAEISYTYSPSKNSAAGSGSSSESETDRHSATILLTLGAEFWLSRHFSLAGQYGLNVRYTSHDYRYYSTLSGSREQTTDHWATGLGGGRVRLAVYF